MMRTMKSGIALSVVLIGAAAWAADDKNTEYMTNDDNVSMNDERQAPGSVSDQGDEYTSESIDDSGNQSGVASEDQSFSSGSKGEAAMAGDDSMAKSTKSESEVGAEGLSSEVVGIKPQLGVLTFNNSAGQTQSRFAAGFTLDANVFGGAFGDKNRVFFGPSTGLIYSHIGSSVGNQFFGSGDYFGDGSYMNIPLNLKLGYTVLNAVRLSAHGGGNLTYRSSGTLVSMSSSDTTSSGSIFKGSNSGGADWTIYPNVGADLEVGLGKHVSLMARPDWTLAPGNDVFTGTLALGIPLS